MKEIITWHDIFRVSTTCPNRWRHEDKKPVAAVPLAEHAAIFSESNFLSSFAREPDKSDFNECLTSDADIQRWLKEKGVVGSSGKKYDELIKLVEMTGESPNILKKIHQEFYREIGDKTAIKAADYDRILQMRHILKQQSSLWDMLQNGDNRVTLTHEIEEFSLKVVIDCITNDGKIIDYMGVSSASSKGVLDLMENGGGWIKCALAHDIYKKVTGDYPNGVYILAQERTFPNVAELYQVVAAGGEYCKALDLGRRQYNAAIQMLKRCYTTNNWPGYSFGQTTMLEPRAWTLKQWGINDDNA